METRDDRNPTARLFPIHYSSDSRIQLQWVCGIMDLYKLPLSNPHTDVATSHAHIQYASGPMDGVWRFQ